MRQARGITVFTAGCFNRIHKAHVKMLKRAGALGERLVVVLANDKHNRKPTAVPAKTRLARLKKLAIADQIIIGMPDSFVKTLRQVRPDILALGYDQKLPDGATRLAVKEMGIRTVVMPWFPGKEETINLDA